MKRVIYARILLLIMALQIFGAAPAFALTGGPAQPEFQAFEPVNTTEMVNLPDGGFTYNIPLMDIGGYPLNLSYHSEISADMEASCVGLGWSVNPGVINRNVRALPDDFNGEKIKKEYNLKANKTFGASAGVSFELFGLDFLKLGLSLGAFYNNYWGIGYEFGVSPSISAGNKGSGKLTAGLGTSLNSQSGASFNPSLSYSKKMSDKNEAASTGISASLSTQINSREGLKAISVSANASRNYSDVKKGESENEFSFGVGSSSSFDFAGKTFTPEFAMPQTNISLSMNFKPAGVELFGTNVAFDISGYFSTQFLRNTSVQKSAYGLLYAQNGAGSLHSLMDFNREKDGAFHDYSVHLPLVNAGYDVLSVNGQGISGSFQLKRSDVPIFYDAQSIAEGGGGSLGLEIGTGNTAHGGVDLKFNYTNSTSGMWTSGNQILGYYGFSSHGPLGYEPAYYKAAGEMAIESDNQFYAAIGRDLAVYAPFLPAGSSSFNLQTSPQLRNIYGGNVSLPALSPIQRVKRERRNQVITYLTAAEASKVGLTKKINAYTLEDFVSQPTKLNRVTNHRKSHHLSQIESIQPDGMRYIYGIPAYNLIQKEVSFTVSSSDPINCSKSTVTYNASENSTSNTSGQDHYFNSVETPAFAHTYLLTAILGKDYEDLTQNGPSIDDYGSYTEIRYSKMKVGSDSIYHWRVPYGQSEANFNAGLYSTTRDDKGTYIYGQKEIWLVHSIVSKTMQAEFYYSGRSDGLGVIGENGGQVTYSLNQKLDSIKLYSIPDRRANGPNATPIKIIHFQYEYSLCPQTENSIANLSSGTSAKGKLTLTSLYFTYGNSKKGKFSDYKFFYKNDFSSFGYSSKDFDRWGNYKKNIFNNNCINPRPGNNISNDEFPYAEQDPVIANSNAGTWSLNRIELPSGGIIKVDYKAKHYAYVQDRPAMRLMNITGIQLPGATTLHTGTSSATHYFKVLFDIYKPTLTPAELKRDYLKNIITNDTYIYLKCYVKMNSNPALTADWEYVTVYCQISNYGVQNGQGFVELTSLQSTDKGSNAQLNPITKYALQYLRENMPETAYGQSAVDENSDLNLDLYKPLASMGDQLMQFVNGFNDEMIKRGYCKEIALDRSFIRLYEPSGFKYGGGSMVTRIEVEDKWGSMTGNTTEDFSYGQEYDYTMTQPRAFGRDTTISSGVASYEPLIGGDDNPLRTPVVISQARKMAVDNVHYVEEPFGEVFMPSPHVVFSKITVRNLQYKNVTRTATGHTEMKYYTARDFPVKTRRTDLEKEPRRVHPLLSLLKVKMKEHMNASQGYLVELNDMHGKPKSNEVYDENGTKISGVSYQYKTKATGELENNVEVIHPDGSVSKGILGVNYSLAGDARESKTKTMSGGVAFNLDGFIVGPIPVIVPLPWPQFEQSEEQFRSMSFTKVVNKFGILEKVEAYDLGSRIATDNLAYDAETGEVLLTRTYNEFDDPIYNLKLPAHWAYKGMQGAYKNIGFLTQAVAPLTAGVCQLDNSTAQFFMPGDELLVNNSKKAWVLHVNTANDQLFLIDSIGKQFPLIGTIQDPTIKIIRSGYHNMPASSIGNITSMENPIDYSAATWKLYQPNMAQKILQADATEYSENWQTFCCDFINSPLNNQPQVMNPFLNNVLGEWRPKKSWLYLTQREKASIVSASSTNIRDNGYYQQFTPFWNLPSNPVSFWNKNENNWIWSATTTQINPNGTELESKNKLELYSAEILGYYSQLITGVASNSRYRQLAFEGFEDFNYNASIMTDGDCQFIRHFGNGFERDITNETYHSGKYSLKLPHPTSQTTSSQYRIEENCPLPTPGINISRTSGFKNLFSIEKCNCIQKFSPDTGKYVLTAWVKEGTGIGQRNYTNHALHIKTDAGASTNVVFKASGPIIDGWQRIEGEFRIDPLDSYIIVELVASSASITVYFDDIRILPFHASMKNYVYDDISLKLLAELDDNGYAKFYEYSAEGELIRIKQETERGIMTIQESRSSLVK